MTIKEQYEALSAAEKKALRAVATQNQTAEELAALVGGEPSAGLLSFLTLHPHDKKGQVYDLKMDGRHELLCETDLLKAPPRAV